MSVCQDLFELLLLLNVHPIIMETILFPGGTTHQWDELLIDTKNLIEIRPYCYGFETIPPFKRHHFGAQRIETEEIWDGSGETDTRSEW
jgi:hypothetical protein